MRYIILLLCLLGVTAYGGDMGARSPVSKATVLMRSEYTPHSSRGMSDLWSYFSMVMHQSYDGAPYLFIAFVVIIILQGITMVLLVVTRKTRSQLIKKKFQDESFYQTIINDAPVYIARGLPDGTVVYANEAYCRFIGVDTGRKFNIRNFIRSESWDKIVQFYRNATPHNSVFSIETCEMPHGNETEEYTIQWLIRVIFDDRQRPQTTLAIGQDITGIRRAYKALESNKQKLKIVSDFTYDWESWVSPTGALLYVSPSCERISGYSVEEFVQNPDLFTLRILPCDRNIYEQYLKKPQKLHHIQYRFKRKDQSFVWIEHISQPVIDPAGNPQGTRISRRDITARKKAESALRDSEERLRTTMQSISEAVFTLNLSKNIINMNSAAEKLSGYNISDAIGKPAEDIMVISQNRSDTIPLDIDSLIKTLICEQDNKQLSTSYVMKSANAKMLFDVTISCSYLQNSYGETTGIVLVITDITHKNILENQLRHTQKMEAIGQLAGGIAHDFNNMISGIIGAAELIQTKNESGSSNYRHAETVIRVGESAAKMTRQLLTFARKDHIRTEVIDVNSIASDAIEMLSRSIGKEITLTSDLSAPKSGVVADKSQLENVIINLVLNARDAISGSGNIIVSTSNRNIDNLFCSQIKQSLEEGEYIQIDISDDGSGIDPDILDKIFNPFFTTKDVDKGTGLGLSVTYGVIHSFHGAITVDSAPGKGTTFSIYLPCTRLISRVQTTKQKLAKVKDKTVLIVDDEEPVRSTCAQLLEAYGYTVLIAENGYQAVEIFADHCDLIDAVVMDLIMPVLDGRKAFYKMKEINKDLKVIISSGYSGDNDIEQLYEDGICHFLKKPYRQHELLKILNAITSGK